MTKKISTPIAIGIIIILAVAVGAGVWWYGQKSQPSESKNLNNSIPDSTFHFIIDSMIGGGFAGAVNTILINSKGEIYRTHSPQYNIEPKKELLKRVDIKLIESLRNSLIEGNIFEMDSGAPHYSGKRWEVIINGSEKKIYFTKTPDNLLKTEKILEEILK